MRSKDFKDIQSYISKEHEVFKVYYQQLSESIQAPQSIMELGKLMDKGLVQQLVLNDPANLDGVYRKVLLLYS